MLKVELKHHFQFETDGYIMYVGELAGRTVFVVDLSRSNLFCSRPPQCMKFGFAESP
jgi:hypothetical protein